MILKRKTNQEKKQTKKQTKQTTSKIKKKKKKKKKRKKKQGHPPNPSQFLEKIFASSLPVSNLKIY